MDTTYCDHIDVRVTSADVSYCHDCEQPLYAQYPTCSECGGPMARSGDREWCERTEFGMSDCRG